MSDDSDDYVTFAEAAAAVATPTKTVMGWADGERVRTRPDCWRPRQSGPARRLVSLASVRAYHAKQNQPVPPGYVTVPEAARICGVSQAIVRNRVYQRKVQSLTVRRNGQPTRYVLAADCVPPPPPPALPEPEPDNVRPVLYGILTSADVRLLEQRRAMFEARLRAA